MPLHKRSFKELNKNIDDDFIDDDYNENDDYEEYSDISDEECSDNSNKENKTNPKIQKIKNMIKDQEIDFNDIVDLNISDEEKMWFYEHIQILRELQQHTEERYKQKQLIYKRYIEVIQRIANTSSIKYSQIEEQLKKKVNTHKDLLTRILESDHNDDTKAVMYKKYCMLNNLDMSDEKYKIYEFIEIILGIPTKLKTTQCTENINTSLINLEKALTTNIYGLNDAKEKLLEIYCGMLSNPNYKNRCLAFVGAPGVGKTAFAKTIAESLDLPFEQISMGSVKDATSLTGHSMTYIGAQVGLIVSAFRRLGYKNGVIFFDELDKVPATPEGRSILSVLLHVLDRKQNDAFMDMYAPEIKIDLSNILFLVAMNDDTKIDPILRDRLHLIKIQGYTVNDKINIARDYILPKIMNNLSLCASDVIISDDIIQYIIEHNDQHKNEKGVRQLEIDLTTICEKINVIHHMSKINKHKRIKLSYHDILKTYKKPFVITKHHIDKLLNN